MIVAISIKKTDKHADVCEVFSKSKYFIFYDSSFNTKKCLLNPYSSELGGSGIQSAQFLIENKVEALITKDIGTNSLRLFKSANIKVFNCPANTIVKVIKHFNQNKLLLLDMVETNHFINKRRKNLLKYQ